MYKEWPEKKKKNKNQKTKQVECGIVCFVFSLISIPGRENTQHGKIAKIKTLSFSL